MILFTAPKSSAGQGYLRIDKNLWFYDPSVGKWERRTERERIGGTNSRRSDFDESRLAEEYDPTDEGEEKLGVYTAQKLKLTGKPGRTSPSRSSTSGSTRTARTSSSGRSTRCRAGCCGRRTTRSGRRSTARRRRRDTWYPEEIRFYDEVEKANQTLVLIKSVDLNALPQNLFTKAWLESKSR